MRRVVSLWLPHFQTDRLRSRKRRSAPVEALVTTWAERGTERVAAVSAEAQAAGLAPGMTLADARALCPDLAAHAAEPGAEARALAALAEWCTRYTPWTTAEAPAEGTGAGAGIFLDVSGCAHLLGGEAALLGDLLARIRRQGFAARAGLADTPGAAWAAARFADAAGRGAIVPAGGTWAAIEPLPVRALRLPGATVEGLARLGLRRIGDLAGLPRRGLARRFGQAVARRLDEALGRASEPLSPRLPVHPWRERLALAEPVARAEDLVAGLRLLLPRLCSRLERGHRGARRLELLLYASDGTMRRLAVGTSRPARAPDHLLRLFAEPLEAIEPPLGPGAGIEVMVLAAPVTDPLSALQLGLGLEAKTAGAADGAVAEAWLADLVDRLGNRLGADNVARLAPRESHLPERAQRLLPSLRVRGALPPGPWPARGARPLRLLERPEAIEAVAEVPDGPPVLFRWRRGVHRVTRAEGPERIAPEWWRPLERREAGTRDYFRVEDHHGRRFWLYRHGLYLLPGQAIEPPPAWFLHGLFA